MNKELPLISICILNWNGTKRLPKAIPSILSQDYQNLEFLFLDN
jgi:glycosyltransferase involved in cell wall biosynthesis